jgi:phytanoyl-CoA hydroxylase
VGAAEMIDADSYRKNGYVLCNGLFSRQEVARVRDEAKNIFIAQMLRHGIVSTGELSEAQFDNGMFALFERDVAGFANAGKQAQHLISLHRLSLDDRITERLNRLGLSFPNISTRPLLYFNAERLAKREVYWRLAPHQDWRSMQGSLDSIVVWVSLVDINQSLGALEVIPGSHHWGLLSADMLDGYGHLHDGVPQHSFLPVEVTAGDALFFSTLLVHRSGTNVTDTIRWSCHFRYNNMSEATFIARGYPHPYIYKPQAELITPGFPDRAQIRQVFDESGD